MARRLCLLVCAVVLLPNLGVALDMGQPAPHFDLPRLGADGSVSLASFRGKVVVLDFWASWCRPCVQALPELDGLQRQYGARGLQVLAVSLDEESQAAQGAIGASPRAFTALHDRTSTVAGRYGVGGALPATVVIDRAGRVRFVHQGGAVDMTRLRTVLQALL